MRLNLHAKTASKKGYTPDWIAIEYKNQDQTVRLTMDIQGETSYDKEELYTQTKGELAPFEYRTEKDGNTKFKDLYELDEEELEDYLLLFNALLKTAERVIVGVYPTDDTNYEEKLKTLDPSKEFTECNGVYEYKDNFGNHHSIEFEFKCEVY